MNESELKMVSKLDMEKMNVFKHLKEGRALYEKLSKNSEKMNDKVNLLIEATRSGARVADQLAASAMKSINLKDETKAETIEFHKARINGLKQKNGVMSREIANNEQNISNIHEKIMVLEEEIRWERFINYCNSFC